MLLINCEINLILTWSANCVIFAAAGVKTFAIKDTKLYVPMKLLEKLVQVKEMIIQLVAYLIIITSNKITRQLILLEIQIKHETD